MAIPHLRAQIIGAGKSAVRYAAYRHRTRMFDELEGSHTHRYDRQKDLVYSEFVVPNNKNLPIWLSKPIGGMKSNSEKSEWLWNYVQNHERVNGQLSREIVIALPNELSREQNINLVREFVETNITKRGLVSDWVYHEKVGNPHIHLMHTLRPVGDKGFGKKKIPVLNADGSIRRKKFMVIEKDGTVRTGERIVYENVIGYKDACKALRISWGDIASKHLAMAGYDIKIDMHSFAKRGISIVPTLHLGQSACAMQAKGRQAQVVIAANKLKDQATERIKDNPDEILKIISYEKSTFTKKDIARTLKRYVDDAGVFNDILTRIGESKNLIRLQNNNHENRVIYSTRDIIETEYHMIQNVNFLLKEGGHGVRGDIVAKAIAAVENKSSSKIFKLTSEQIGAVQHVVADEGVAAVVGYAGAGKSTLLEAANLAWTMSGHRVFGAALSGKAAEGLEQSSGIKSRTLASWEYGWERGKDNLLKGDVFVIDEAGMVSSRQLSRFIDRIKTAGAKAVVVGDPMQLQPIEAGAPFRAIIDKIGYVELSGIRRQKADWARAASIKFGLGKVKEALSDYQQRGFIHHVREVDEAIEKITHDWMEFYRKISGKPLGGREVKGDALIILSHTNEAVAKLNASIRQALKDEDFLSLGDGDRGVDYITPKGVREFIINDRIIFLKNARFDEPTAPQLGRQEVKNGMLGTVVAIRKDRGERILKVRLDSGREVEFSNETYQDIDHGYATTIHKSQGITVDNAFVLASPSMDKHLTYVAMSRHRENVHLYFADQDFENVLLLPKYRGNNYDQLVSLLSRNGIKSVTTDYAHLPDYRDYIAQFTNNHGIDTNISFGEKLHYNIKVIDEWIHEMMVKGGNLWNRAGHAFEQLQNTAMTRGNGISINIKNVPTNNAKMCLEGVICHKISVEETAKNIVRKEKSYIDSFNDMTRILEKIYKDPQSAAVSIERTILAGKGDDLADILRKSPSRAGQLRGSSRWLDKWKKSGRERKLAVNNTPLLVSKIRDLQSFYKNSYDMHVSTEKNNRERMKHGVPALSPGARDFIKAVEMGRASYANIPLSIEKEFLTVNDALNARFGHDAVHRRDFNMMHYIAPQQHLEVGGMRELSQVIKFIQGRRKSELQQLSQTRIQARCRGIRP